MEYEYHDIESALAAVDSAMQDSETDDDTVYWDMVQAIHWFCTPEIALELCRITGVSAPE